LDIKSSTLEQGTAQSLTWNKENGQFKIMSEGPPPAAQGSTAASTGTAATANAPKPGDTTGQDSTTTAPAATFTVIYNEGGVQDSTDPKDSFPSVGGVAVFINVGQ
jgi:hypothetical protein